MILADTGVLIDQSFPDDEEIAASILSRAELVLGIALAKNPAQAKQHQLELLTTNPADFTHLTEQVTVRPAAPVTAAASDQP
ncbi:MAG: hypothetical protein LBR32_00365 [Propionibacteriaceae bacterium]|nr:hypothetical protein [Propionibacteriaceae bacterium]